VVRYLGLGPVFVYEAITSARRRPIYVWRVLFVLLLLAGMTLAWYLALRSTPGRPRVSRGGLQNLARMGEFLFYALSTVQISLILLAAPAATAGVICIERARGTLLHLMVTDLSDAEIVLGKLGARLAPVLGLLVCGVPVTALAALLGGIDFGALAGLFVVATSVAIVGCALALAFSLRASRSHDVLLAVYMIEGLYLLALPIVWDLMRSPPSAWFQKVNPYLLALAPYTRPGYTRPADFALFAAGSLGLSAALVGWSIARLRQAALPRPVGADRLGRARRAWRALVGRLPGPALDVNPILWREWHRNRPSRLGRWLWGIMLLLTWSLGVWGAYFVLRQGDARGVPYLLTGVGLQLFFGFLMVSAAAPTVLAEERVRGSLDVLLVAPASTASIVVAKWLGLYRWVLVLLPLPLLAGVLDAASATATPTIVPSLPPKVRLPPPIPLRTLDRVATPALGTADFLASGALLVGLGVALGTWVRRQGRALALSVAAYFALGIAWIFLIEMLTPVLLGLVTSQNMAAYPRQIARIATSLSPIAGPLAPGGVLRQVFYDDVRSTFWIGFAIVVAIKWALAGGLLLLTIRTFDHCLGRMAERPRRRRAERADAAAEPAPGAVAG
jgi:ABC-type transport system involved in multi-copper enzyme maturation permease subunit